uniref:poly(A)-specific ribonuclease n=1 Tax=Acrobeloides nanus TaxID=290746 RepID=A0A914D0P9_9BILA
NEGIRMEDFGELLTTSGLIVDSKITWLTFHSCFDFGYLIKSILNGHLPMDEKEFFRYYKAFFPKSYDIKMLMKEPGPASKLKGGLQDVADTLQVIRIGRRHQAGSDALLTARTFFKIKELFFADNWNEISEQVQGHMYGLGNTLSNPAMYLPPVTPISNSGPSILSITPSSLADATSTSAIYASLQNDDLGSSVSSES